MLGGVVYYSLSGAVSMNLYFLVAEYVENVAFA